MKNRMTAVLAGCLLIWSMAGPSFAAVIDWADWQTFERPIPPGVFISAQGTIGDDVGVAYTGSAWSVLTNCIGGDYWTEPDPTNAPYTGSSLIDNRPPCDAIRLDWPTTHTVTFSEPVWMPLMAIVTMGDSSTAVTYDFGAGVQFSVLSEGQGTYGDGTYTLGDGSITGNEFHGVIQFEGWVDQISWTSSGEEVGWHGFTFGIAPYLATVQCRITSFLGDGTLTWSNSVSNLYCGIEYTAESGGYWNEAPGEFWNIWTTGLVGTVQVPISEIEDPAMFFRVVCSTNLLGDYYDLSNGIPRFVSTDYIELDKITAISRFRSGYGHDYSDDFESCRSMKHYYEPLGSVTWSNILIRSPVSGTVIGLKEEWAGTQVMIKSTDYPAFYFILFHVALSPPVALGDTVTEGQLLGTHIGYQTISDIAVLVKTLEGERLVSYFDVMTDPLFTNYMAQGAANRSDFIITEAERDADPLICDGETFLTPGTIPNWVYLTSPE